MPRTLAKVSSAFEDVSSEAYVSQQASSGAALTSPHSSAIQYTTLPLSVDELSRTFTPLLQIDLSRLSQAERAIPASPGASLTSPHLTS